MTNSLPVGATISEAWDKVGGAKGSIWAAIGTMLLIAVAVGFVTGLLNSVSLFLGATINLAGQFAIALLQVGILYIGIQRAKNSPITFKQIFCVFDLGLIVKIVGVYLIQFLIMLPIVILYALPLFSFFGFSLNSTYVLEWNSTSIFFLIWSSVLSVVAIYLGLRMYLSLAFVLDQQLSAWSAVKMAFKVSDNHVLALFMLALFQIAIFVLSIFTLGIAFIWTIPLMFILYGMTYKNITQ